jgi:acetyl esterase
MPLDVAALRAASEARARDRPRGPDLASIEDLILPDTPAVRARRYRADVSGPPRPTLVYLHGGMWVIGDLQSHDRLCRQLAAHAHVDVLAVDYRRAPEHRYPAPIDDAIAAIRWLHDHTTTPAIGLGGDSAGGTIATLTALALRDSDIPLAALILFCPNTDLTADVASPEIIAAAHLWAPEATTRALASPLLTDDLTGLPPTLLLTAEHDTLRAEGDALATRLTAAAVPVTHRTEPGAEHGFVLSDGPPLDRALADVATLLGRR